LPWVLDCPLAEANSTKAQPHFPPLQDVVINMNRLILTFVASIVIATAAFGQPRPQTPTMSCGQARHLVATRGAIVLGTGRYTYDRYVSGQEFCLVGEWVWPAWVPSADTPQCPVGYTCKTDPPWLFFDD
jgi:hypothetical protein